MGKHRTDKLKMMALLGTLAVGGLALAGCDNDSEMPPVEESSQDPTMEQGTQDPTMEQGTTQESTM